MYSVLITSVDCPLIESKLCPQPALVPQFKARAPTVLHRKPFEPVKPNRQLPLPDVTLASEIRAKDRELFDQQQIQKELEMEAARQQVSSFFSLSIKCASNLPSLVFFLLPA